MPRQVARPPSGNFTVRPTQPFSGTPTHTGEVIGGPNRSAVVRVAQYNSCNRSSEKDDVNELTTLVNTVRGCSPHPSKYVYGQDVKVDFNTFEIQWSNEQKDDYKRIADSIEALASTFPKQDAAI